MTFKSMANFDVSRRAVLGAAGALAATAIVPRALATESASFPDGFLWGAASAAGQVESRDGRGRSNWDVFADQGGRIRDGSTNDVNTEFESRYAEDLRLLGDAGIGAFRFSVSWPRIQPDGSGEPNAAGIDAYDRIIDEMLRRGIVPLATMVHWDTPVWAGDFRDREIAKRLADYADILTRRFGDRVKTWLALNEPNSVAAAGYAYGIHAPGVTSLAAAGAAMHHQNLATSLMLTAARANLPGDARVATTINLQSVRPVSDTPEDAAAAKFADAFWNTAWLDPLFGKGYPDEVEELVAPYVKDGDIQALAVHPDFIGMNYYSRLYVRADGKSPLGFAVELANPPGNLARTAFYPVDPDGLTETLLRVHAAYGEPDIYITETGFALVDPAPANGVVEDPERIAYLKSYLHAARDAIRQGVRLKGMFYWSATDNWEWAEGFSKTFGLVQIDRETQARTPKRSLEYWGRCSRENRIV